MILDYLKEDIEGSIKLTKESKKYPQLSEDEFMQVATLDPTTSLAKGLGNVAGQLLLPKYASGEKDFINNADAVKDACSKFYAKRQARELDSTHINLAAYPTVKAFLDYMSGENTEVELNTDAAQQAKRHKQTPEEKLEVVRQQGFPNIPDVQTLMKIASFDPQCDWEHGILSNIIKNYILKWANKGDDTWTKKPRSLKNAIIAYNKDVQNGSTILKQHPLDELSLTDADGTELPPTMAFIDLYYPSIVKPSNFLTTIQTLLKEGTDFKIVAQDSDYDTIEELSYSCGLACDFCNRTVSDYVSYKQRHNRYPSRDAIYNFGYDNKPDANSNSGGNSVNTWCTGWSDDGQFRVHAGTPDDNKYLYAFIHRSQCADNTNNWQISFIDEGNYDNEVVHDCERGFNDHLAGPSKFAPQLLSMLEGHPQLVAQLLNRPGWRNWPKFQQLARKMRITTALNAPKNKVENEIETELQPLRYTKTMDIEEYAKANSISTAEIQEIIVDASVKVIPAFEFSGLSGLISVKIEGAEEIGTKAFANCISLSSVTLSSNLKIIGLGAFENDACLTKSIKLPNSIEKICTYAFKGTKARFVVSSSILEIPGKQIQLPKEPESEYNWWSTDKRITISD